MLQLSAVRRGWTVDRRFGCLLGLLRLEKALEDHARQITRQRAHHTEAREQIPYIKRLREKRYTHAEYKGRERRGWKGRGPLLVLPGGRFCRGEAIEQSISLCAAHALTFSVKIS